MMAISDCSTIITRAYITQMAFNRIYIYILDLYKIYCGFQIVRYELLYILSNLIEGTGMLPRSAQWLLLIATTNTELNFLPNPST